MAEEKRKLGQLILARHGESMHNVDKSHREMSSRGVDYDASQNYLTELGIKQATELGEYLADLFKDTPSKLIRIYSSKSPRAEQTADIVVNILNNKRKNKPDHAVRTYELDSRWREQSLGLGEPHLAKNHNFLVQRHDDYFRSINGNLRFRFEKKPIVAEELSEAERNIIDDLTKELNLLGNEIYGENLTDVAVREKDSAADLEEFLKEEGAVSIIITHKGSMIASLQALINKNVDGIVEFINANGSPDNCDLVVYNYEPDASRRENKWQLLSWLGKAA